MAIIALPVTTRFLRKIDWSLDRPAQVNVSAYTGRRGVVANPWHGKWSASCEFAPVVGETNMLAWRAFFARLKGQINTFRIPATEGGQASLAPAVAVASGYAPAAGATQMVVYQGPGSHPISGLLAGHFMTMNDQLLLATSVSAHVASGFTQVNFEPALRAAAVADTAVEIANPTCLVALADSSFGYSVEPGKVYGMAMKVEEAF